MHTGAEGITLNIMSTAPAAPEYWHHATNMAGLRGQLAPICEDAVTHGTITGIRARNRVGVDVLLMSAKTYASLARERDEALTRLAAAQAKAETLSNEARKTEEGYVTAVAENAALVMASEKLTAENKDLTDAVARLEAEIAQHRRRSAPTSPAPTTRGPAVGANAAIREIAVTVHEPHRAMTLMRLALAHLDSALADSFETTGWETRNGIIPDTNWDTLLALATKTLYTSYGKTPPPWTARKGLPARNREQWFQPLPARVPRAKAVPALWQQRIRVSTDDLPLLR